MTNELNLRAGEWVEVRSQGEILATLDKSAQLDGLPFMPQMLKYRGKRLKVYKRAHKTCDTVFPVRGRRMANAVHLETRCDGEAYGGCQAGCLLFWKEAWLKRVPDAETRLEPTPDSSHSSPPQSIAGCQESDVWAATRAPESRGDDVKDPSYVCQATRLPYATTHLPWWDLRQYIEDYASGNVTLWRLARGLIYSTYYTFATSSLGRRLPMPRVYDLLRPLWRGSPFPRKTGRIPKGQPTPTCTLNLQPGEFVRVKSHDEILATLDTDNKNRGLYYDGECVPYSGGVHQVLRRVNQILDEKTGKLIRIKNESVILDGVVCQSRYSQCRMLCPRAIYAYWREAWLERVPGTEGEPSRSRMPS